MKVQWYGLFPSSHLSPHHPFLLTSSTSSARQMRCPAPKRAYTSTVFNASSHPETASQGRGFPSITPLQSRSALPDLRIPCAHQARSTCRRDPNPRTPACPRGPAAACAMLNVDWPALLATLSTSNLSSPTFPTHYLTKSSTRCRRSPAQRGALRCPRCAMRSSPRSQKPPFCHAWSLRSTNHRKHSRRRAPPSRWRGSRSASQAAVGAAEEDEASI